jgi:hypothetical protein
MAEAEAKSSLANRTPVKTEEALKTLLADRGGKQYYAELKKLNVDKEALKKTLDMTRRDLPLLYRKR